MDRVKTSALSGAEIVVRCLQEEGVEYVFGYPGGAVLFIYDEIFKQDKVKHVLVRHEQGAVHAADGYSRSSKKIGVALVTSGPGATNAVTGIANAFMDSTPLVVITGQVPRKLLGTDAFQEVDTVGITRQCTKMNYLVRHADELSSVLHEAFHLAGSGRPGPVLVDIPKDVTAEVTSNFASEPLHLPGYTSEDDMPAIYGAADLLAFPSLYEGFGLPVLEAMSVGCPVLTSPVSSLGEVAGDAAVLVDPQSVDAIAAGLERALTDRELRAQLVERGLRRAAEFSWKRAAAEHLRLYRELAARR